MKLSLLTTKLIALFCFLLVKPIAGFSQEEKVNNKKEASIKIIITDNGEEHVIERSFDNLRSFIEEDLDLSFDIQLDGLSDELQVLAKVFDDQNERGYEKVIIEKKENKGSRSDIERKIIIIGDGRIEVIQSDGDKKCKKECSKRCKKKKTKKKTKKDE